MSARQIIQVSAYYPPHLGGQENLVQDLARQLADAGHQVRVLTSTAGGGPAGTTTEDGVRVQRMSAWIFGHAPIMPWFPAVLFGVTHRRDIVHLHIGQAFTPEMVWLVSRLRGFRYVAELHIDFEPSGPAAVLLPLYKRFVLRRVLRSADAVVTLNQKTLQTVRQTYGCTGPAQIMHNGIDEAYFAVGRLPPGSKPPARLSLLFVGRFSKQKNIIALLQAVHLTKRNVQLDILGDGEERPAIERAIADLKLSNVTVHGRLERPAVMEFYRSSDVLVMPSLYEAQPLVLLEAMAAQIPIIGTNVIGVADHIGQAGIIVEPTAVGLAEGIEQYYANYAAIPEIVKRGYVQAEKLRWKHILREYEALYDTVLGD